MNKPIKGVLIDTVNGTAKPVTLDGSLDAYYKALNCATIDIANRKIGKKYYDIVCDDEGLLTAMPKISAIDSNGEAMLVGNLFVDGEPDDDGYMTSLTDDDVKDVLSHVKRFSTRYYPVPYPMLTCVEY